MPNETSINYSFLLLDKNLFGFLSNLSPDSPPDELTFSGTLIRTPDVSGFLTLLYQTLDGLNCKKLTLPNFYYGEISHTAFSQLLVKLDQQIKFMESQFKVLKSEQERSILIQRIAKTKDLKLFCEKLLPLVSLIEARNYITTYSESEFCLKENTKTQLLEIYNTEINTLINKYQKNNSLPSEQKNLISFIRNTSNKTLNTAIIPDQYATSLLPPLTFFLSLIGNNVKITGEAFLALAAELNNIDLNNIDPNKLNCEETKLIIQLATRLTGLLKRFADIYEAQDTIMLFKNLMPTSLQTDPASPRDENSNSMSDATHPLKNLTNSFFKDMSHLLSEIRSLCETLNSLDHFNLRDPAELHKVLSTESSDSKSLIVKELIATASSIDTNISNLFSRIDNQTKQRLLECVEYLPVEDRSIWITELNEAFRKIELRERSFQISASNQMSFDILEVHKQKIHNLCLAALRQETAQFSQEGTKPYSEERLRNLLAHFNRDPAIKKALIELAAVNALIVKPKPPTIKAKLNTLAMNLYQTLFSTINSKKNKRNNIDPSRTSQEYRPPSKRLSLSPSPPRKLTYFHS